MLNPILSDWEFALFSANIHQFFPTMSWEEHDTLYDKWRTFHHHVRPPLALTVVNIDQLKTLTPGILTLFHLGCHLESPIALADSGLVFDIILDEQVYTTSRGVLNDMLQKLNDLGHGSYTFLFSSDPKLLLKCRSSFKKGKHVLVFADGSSGSTESNKDLRTRVPFLAGDLCCKQGIPRLAFIFDVKIYPFVTTQNHTNATSLELQSIIAPKSGQKKDDFTRTALTALYRMLERAIQNNPWRWECWSYLHSNGMLDTDLGRRNEQFAGQGPYLFVRARKGFCLFDRRYYCVQEINLSRDS